MTERLNNEQISQRILKTNSDVQRYLNLAPSLKPTPCHPKSSPVYPPRFDTKDPVGDFKPSAETLAQS